MAVMKVAITIHLMDIESKRDARSITLSILEFAHRDNAFTFFYKVTAIIRALKASWS